MIICYGFPRHSRHSFFHLLFIPGWAEQKKGMDSRPVQIYIGAGYLFLSMAIIPVYVGIVWVSLLELLKESSVPRAVVKSKDSLEEVDELKRA
uniref:Sec-independent protein translocase TatC n=1 Tax=Steinernema glaseri TaxID=37863 RepID=A0A1I7ZST3_9BILA